MADRTDIEDLIARLPLGDRQAFATLYDLTSAKLFGLCLRVLKDRSEAEDCLQDVYLKIWHNADRYRVTGHSPITWMTTIARNAAIDRLRARAPETQDIDTAPDLVHPGPGPEAAVIARAEAARIGACLDELPRDRADAVRGAYLDGDSYADLALRHGVPLNTMRTWLRRGLQALRECLTR